MIHLRHRWVTLAVQQMESVTYMLLAPLNGPDPEPTTEVLQRCSEPRCAKLRTTTLTGHWTLDDLQAQP